MGNWNWYRRLNDEALTAKLKDMVERERRSSVDVLACLGEFDRRRLYSKMGFPSLFDYCVRELRYSESAAARRIHAARAAREWPEIFSYLSDGSLSLSAVSLLAPHLTQKNRAGLLTRAQGRSKRELERLVAEVSPRPDRTDCIRYVSPPSGAGDGPPGQDDAGGLFDAAPCGEPAGPGPTAAEPEARSETAPLGPTQGSGAAPGRAVEAPRVRFSFTASEALLCAVERARELLRHKHPSARLEDVFREALREYLDRHDPARRLARRRKSSAGAAPPAQGQGVADGRRVPQWVKDKVWERDGGCCSFVSVDGRRCQARARLEYDHIQPYALGGASDDPGNVRLLCRTHNQLRAREMFGEAVPDRSGYRRGKWL